MKVLVSPFKNPFINLALEDYFLRGGFELPVLFLYVNRPCVVLGRFQNPWSECHLPFLAESDIWLVRRQSGGGCVFHDEGNLNYSFIYSDGMIDRRKGVEWLKSALSKADVDLEISPRHDLWLKGKKISGSAFKQIKNASFHHGTFLVSSDLNHLEECLKQTLVAKSSKSIASVRSQVTRLHDHFPHFSIDDLIEIFAHEMKTSPETLDGSFLSRPEVQASFRSLVDWGWLWGETPLFELENGLTVHKGMLKNSGEGKFERSNLKEILSAGELDRFFPDFTKQELGCQVVF